MNWSANQRTSAREVAPPVRERVQCESDGQKDGVVLGIEREGDERNVSERRNQASRAEFPEGTGSKRAGIF